MWVSTTPTRHPEPITCRKELTGLRAKKKTIDPANSMHADTNASSALSNVAFIPISISGCEICEKYRDHFLFLTMREARKNNYSLSLLEWQATRDQVI